MFTKRLPNWARNPIENFYQTGQYKQHNKISISDKSIKEDLDYYQSEVDGLIFSDKHGIDEDPRPGHVIGKKAWVGEFTGQYQEGPDMVETFRHFRKGKDDEHIAYSRQDANAFDMIVVSKNYDGELDILTHITPNDPTGSYRAVGFDMDE